jgi:hypothetical protein
MTCTHEIPSRSIDCQLYSANRDMVPLQHRNSVKK